MTQSNSGVIQRDPNLPGPRRRIRYEGVLFDPRIQTGPDEYHADAKENWFGYGKRAMIRYMRRRLRDDGRAGAAIAVFSQDMRKIGGVEHTTLIYQAHLRSGRGNKRRPVVLVVDEL